MVSIAGEKTTEECISWAVKEFAKATACELVDYSVYADVAVSPGRYVIFIELEKTVTARTLRRLSPNYEEAGCSQPVDWFQGKKWGLESLRRFPLFRKKPMPLYRDLMIVGGFPGIAKTGPGD